MEQFLIVDGYNIIGAWPELVRLKDEVSLSEARDRLIDMLAEYQAFSGIKTIVVFDAYLVPGLGGKYNQANLEIHYTKEKETADECIERLVVELAKRRRHIFVATSDFAEQNTAFGSGALRIPARELLSDIEESRKTVKKKLNDATVQQRNSFDSLMNKELRSLFEKWRRGE